MLHLAVTKRARQIQKLLKVRKMDRLTNMLALVKTVELGSFIAAAEALNCTPQAVGSTGLSFALKLLLAEVFTGWTV